MQNNKLMQITGISLCAKQQAIDPSLFKYRYILIVFKQIAYKIYIVAK